MQTMTGESAAVLLTETMWEMRDGVKLYTRIARPKDGDRFPVVFQRSPYEAARNGEPYPADAFDGDPFITHGYAVVWQHCRGRGDSEGDCTPYVERDDGLDSLEHIRRLPFYNGEIYVTGGSYLSTVHLTYLSTEPPDVRGAALNIQSDRIYFRNYRNGCVYDWCNWSWWLSMLKNRYPVQNTKNALVRPYRDIMKRVLGEDFPPFTDCLMHDSYDDHYRADPRNDVMDRLNIPVLFTEGWYDYYLDGMFDMWRRCRPETKAKSAFVVGPYGHGTSVSPHAAYETPDGNPHGSAVEWFDCLRSGKPYPHAELGKVNYYSVGGDFWTADGDPREADGERMYLSEGGVLGGENCPDAKTEQSWFYNPDKRLGCFPYHNIYDCLAPNSVRGVYSFVTAPFTETKSYYGRIRWHMRVRSNCGDTCFFIRVYLVENGHSYNLTETITTLRHVCPDYVPKTPAEIDLFLPPMAFTVKAGCSLRVDVASDGGIYVPHSNTVGHWAEVTEVKVARNSVLLRDSYIVLPEAY